MKRAFAISFEFALAMLLFGIAVGEKNPVRPLPVEDAYGYVYNAECRDQNKEIEGCVRRTELQKCRYPDNPPHDNILTSLPVCAPSNQVTNENSTAEKLSSAVIQRGKRAFFRKFWKFLKKVGRVFKRVIWIVVERVLKNITISYSSGRGWNVNTTG